LSYAGRRLLPERGKEPTTIRLERGKTYRAEDVNIEGVVSLDE